MNGDDMNVPPQRSDQQVRNDHDDEHPRNDTGDGIHREPYGRNDEDVLVASEMRGPGDTGPLPATDATHDTDHDTDHDTAHDAARDPALDAPYDEPHGTVTVTEQVTAVGPGPAQPAEDSPAHAAPHTSPLFDQDPDELQSRWRDLQAAFVDDPAEAVHRADGLVGEVVDSLTNALHSRTGELRERWKGDGGGDTEGLRQALREYRGVLEGLLALSGQNQASGRNPAE